MKFSLTITDATKEEIMAFLAGTTSIVSPMNGSISGASIVANGSNPPAGTITASYHGSNGAAPAGDDDNGPTNINAPSVDTAGIPWDERIHSKNKGLNADGTWRKKRGVDGAAVAAVEAELKMRSAGMQPQPQFTAPSSTVQMPPQPGYQQPPAPQFTAPPQQYQQPPAAQFTAPPQQYQQPQPQPMDFNGFMQHLSGQMAKRDQNGQPLIHVDYLASVCQRLTSQFGRQFNSITDISTDPNAINSAIAFIVADGRWN